jgi:hypothetical protein
MKIKPIISIAVIAFLPIAGFAQTTPTPPASPSQPASPPQPAAVQPPLARPGMQPPPPGIPARPSRREKPPKVPVTFLGVETSQVPSVVSEQLGLAKGFGLVVDYVVPNSPAATAGVQQNDILKMLNDQILIEPSQLRKLLQTFSDGADVTLTILRKGQEQKVTVKLTKKEVPRRHSWNDEDKHEWHWDFDDVGDLSGQMQEMKEHLQEQLGDAQRGVVRETVLKARAAARRARDDARRAAREIRILSSDNGALKGTRIDLGKAQVVFSDDKGEMKLETVDGKRILTAKDPQGKLLFSGPIETREDLDKVPAEVRQRYEQLRQKDLPRVAPGRDADEEESGDADDDEEETPSMEQV